MQFILIVSCSQDSASRWNLYNQKLDSGVKLAKEDAKNYNITHAVIYNEKTDSYNSMFDLNRQLIKEDSNTMILTGKNLEKIISKKKDGAYCQWQVTWI